MVVVWCSEQVVVWTCGVKGIYTRWVSPITNKYKYRVIFFLVCQFIDYKRRQDEHATCLVVYKLSFHIFYSTYFMMILEYMTGC